MLGELHACEHEVSDRETATLTLSYLNAHQGKPAVELSKGRLCEIIEVEDSGHQLGLVLLFEGSDFLQCLHGESVQKWQKDRQLLAGLLTDRNLSFGSLLYVPEDD